MAEIPNASFQWTLTRGGFMALMALIGAALLLGCSSPYHNKELRRTVVPVAIKGIYKAYACGDSFPQIAPVEPLPDDLDASWLDGGLEFRVPADFTGPDQLDELGVAGNQFELLGYYHYVLGEGRRYLHPRFDVYAWRPVLPYRVWSNGSDEAGTTEVVNTYRDESDGWRQQENQPEDPQAYDYARKYNPCL